MGVSFGELRGGPVGWSWGGFWGGEVTDKHKKREVFWKTRVGEWGEEREDDVIPMILL